MRVMMIRVSSQHCEGRVSIRVSIRVRVSSRVKALESAKEAVRRGVEDTEVAFIDETNRSYAWYTWKFSEIQNRNPYLYNKLHVELYR